MFNLLIGHDYKFKPRSWRGILNATLFDKVCQLLATGQWFSLGTPIKLTPRYN
jgi:hypothetical protein